MKLTFDPDFSYGSWPGALEMSAGAVAGEEWVGEAGLLGRVETALGLGGPAISEAERAAAIVPALCAREGFWSASAVVDPLGAARRLLLWRDTLVLGGWSAGRASTPWLAALADVTADAPAGSPDRLASVTAMLARRDSGIEEVVVLRPSNELSLRWRDLLDALGRRGTRVEHRSIAPAAPTECDLHAARGKFHPQGDGSLQLVRPYGPLAAADAIGAWLAAEEDLASTVIVGGDSVLDAALRRHGLPTTGAAAPARENLLLQIVPLVLALGWQPADPQRALELLTLPLGPVPPAIARVLARALHEWPAVGSDDWRAALDQGLGEMPEPRQARVRARLAILLEPSVPRGMPFPAPEVERRLAALDGWLRARQAVEREPALGERWQAPLDQIGATRRLLAAARLETLSAAQLQWLIEAATESVRVPPPRPAEAGLAAVGAPGAVAGPARVVVWWNFLLDGSARVERLPFAPAERAALLAAGVELPDPGREAMALAARWRRPFLQARERLLLVAPRRGSDGEEAFPHPLWDELAARADEDAALARLVVAEPTGSRPLLRSLGTRRTLPRPRRAWTAPAELLVARERESPTSLSSFVGCTLRWALEGLGGLRAGETGALPRTEQLSGTLAHRLLELVLTGEFADDPVAARREAERLFDALGPRLAAPFFLPGADDTRAEARLVVGASAAALAGLLAATGLRVAAAESDVTATQGPWTGRLRGRPDLVLAGRADAESLPATIVDLKWGGASYRRRTLAEGTALQLAAYGELLRGDRTEWPAAAFFILKQQRLLTTTPELFPGAEGVDGASLSQTWEAFERSHTALWKQLSAGALYAPGNAEGEGKPWPDEDSIMDGELVLAPPCKFCDLGALCGRIFAEQR